MNYPEPAAARCLPDYIRRFLWSQKPTKQSPKHQHLPAVHERNEMLERHEKVRKSIRDVFEKVLEKKLSWESDEFNKALFMACTPFTIDRPGAKPKHPGFTWFLFSDAPESLLTAKEHVDFYEDILKNKGFPNFGRLASECRTKASTLDQANVTGASTLKQLTAAYRKQADRYDSFAKHPEQSPWWYQRSRISLKDIRSRAKFWKALQFPSSEMASAVLSGDKAILGDIDPLQAAIALILQAENKSIKKSACRTMTLTTVQGVAHLLAAAMAGDSEPLEVAVTALNHMVSMLSDFVSLYPETSLKVGRTVEQWPILCSPHRALADDAERIMERVGLGKDFDFLVAHGARWDLREQFTGVARDLYLHIEAVRRDPDILHFLPYAQAAVALPPIPHNPRARAASDAAQKWWNVAKEAFLFSYPEPQTLRSLADLVTGEASRSAATIRARILVRLEARFLKLFGSIAHRKLAENESSKRERKAK